MNEKERTKTSRFMSLVLRHQPEVANVELDKNGWVDVDILLAGMAAAGRAITREELDEIVVTSPKQRFALNEDGTRIRANQGHSIDVELGYEAASPPDRLFHGTYADVVDIILRDGLSKMKRHHVHLSADVATATQVGARRGKPIILEIDANAMVAKGLNFYVSTNGVWLTDFVPPEAIRLQD